jgi:hypothetical protein
MHQLCAAASDKIDTLEACCQQGGPSSRMAQISSTEDAEANLGVVQE